MKDIPLVVDLDGTLTPIDTLVESVVRLVRRNPLNLFRVPLWLIRGRAAFKAEVASRVGFAADLLPLREPLMTYLHEQKALGRKLILATAAHRSIADPVAAHLGIFDEVIASDAQNNLKGRHKLEAIRKLVGPEFAYAGDSTADLPIWKAARSAVLVGTSAAVSRQVRETTSVELELASPAVSLKMWLRQLRVHQWMKNVLLFVPLLTSFAFTDVARVSSALMAFVAFSLMASATYVVNDLWDLDSDRAHPRKKSRPLASGAMPVAGALGVAFALLLLALVLAWQVNGRFVLMLLGYVVLTSAYSWYLKTFVLLDVLMLAGLFTLRILAGAVAISLPTSSWLLAFSIFIFFSLALVKRCSELVAMQQHGSSSTRGRDYRVSDLVVLWPTGVAAGLASVVVFGLFISAPDAQRRYAAPELMWLVGFGLIYWLSRLWIKTARGEMHDDPLVYALMDRTSRLTVIGMVLTALAAYFVHLG